MIKKNKNIFKTVFTLVFGTAVLFSCEAEPDNLGSQFFQNGAEGTEASYDIVIFNNSHNDTIKSDEEKIVEATLGAFDEPVFGKQKSAYVTQVRLASYNPDFGTNPEVDSVVLQLKPFFQTAADSVKTTTYEDVTYEGNAAKKVLTTYPVKKYGKAKLGGTATSLTLNVHAVNDFLESYLSDVYSNRQVALGMLLGTKTFDGNLRAIKITKKTDNAELFSRDPGLRISLDKDYFQTNLINKKGSMELNDAASFIRFFKGLRISVAEDDGYLFNFNPNEITGTVYYKYDKTENGTTSRPQSSFSLDLGSSNVHFNQIEYTRPSSFTTAMASSNKITGDPKIYLQGMGGPGAEVKIPAAVIAQLKDLYNTQKIGILSAKIKLYTDASSWNNTYAKPTTFATLFKEVSTASGSPTTAYTFLDDLFAFQYSSFFRLINAVDLNKNPAYYEISITQSLRNMIEKESTSDKSITLDVGDFRNGNASFLGTNFTTRAYTPNRVVLVGTDPSNTQYKAQLKVIYSKKQ